MLPLRVNIRVNEQVLRTLPDLLQSLKRSAAAAVVPGEIQMSREYRVGYLQSRETNQKQTSQTASKTSEIDTEVLTVLRLAR